LGTTYNHSKTFNDDRNGGQLRAKRAFYNYSRAKYVIKNTTAGRAYGGIINLA
jgi:hypothetical protein